MDLTTHLSGIDMAMARIVNVKFYLFALFFVFSCTLQNPMQDYQKNNNKIRSETPKSYQQNQINYDEPINVKHCTELYGCYTEKNFPEEIIQIYSEENDPQLKIVECTSPDGRPICLETKKELIDKLEKSLDKVKFQCKDLGFKEGTEKFGECVLELSE